MEDLLLALKEKNIDISVVEGNIELDIPDGVIADEIIDKIKSNREGIIQYILNERQLKNGEILSAPVQDYYPLSHSQRRLYFLYELDRSSLAYNMTQVFELKGRVDITKFEGAFSKLVDRHASLRTSFVSVNGEPKQKISPKVTLSIGIHEAPKSGAKDVIKKLIRPFNLEEAPLIRVELIKVLDSVDTYYLIVDIHHIVSDGVSQNILVKDFMALYRNDLLAGLNLQYKDYAVWQQERVNSESFSIARKFWQNEFSGELQILELPTDFARSSTKSHEGAIHSFLLEPEVSRKLVAIGEDCRATKFMTLLAVFNILLTKLSNQEDITIGTGLAGRDHEGLEGIIGMFVNTIAIRTYPNAELSFTDFLRATREKTLNCFAHQSYPYEELVDLLKINRDISRNPLFDVMFVFHNFDQDKLLIPGLELIPYEGYRSASTFDLTLIGTEKSGQFKFSLQYASSLFSAESIARFARYFKQLAKSIIRNPDQKIREISVLPDSERNLLLREFNSTSAFYPNKKTLIDLFEQQVSRTPKQMALVIGDSRISYEELNSHANLVAENIKAKINISPAKVGLLFDPSVEMIACILGVLKLGCTYVPLSPESPNERNTHILKDCEASLLLIQEHLASDQPGKPFSLSRDKVLVVSNLEDIEKAIPNPGRKIGPEDLIYIIYTSGSTGIPKGVEVRHKGAVNYIFWRNSTYNLTSEDRIWQSVSYHFDGFYSNLFSAFLAGGTLVFPQKEDRLEVGKLVELFEVERITNSSMTPGIYELLINELETTGGFSLNKLKSIVLAGEKASKELIEKSSDKLPHVLLHNEYGPTEASIGATHLMGLNASNTSIIGKPIANTSIYILGKHRELLPIGVEGELYISGAGLAKGYVNNKELTYQRFTPHPFKEGEKIYGTGDLARWLPDGNLEYLGRKDNQVKLRGYRIELGEIENQLLSHEDIRAVVVITKDLEINDKYLVAYFVSGKPVSSFELRGFLSERIPEYMIPSYFVRIDQVPLNSNGKLDRKALPDPDHELESEFIAPINEIEETLVRICAEVLNLDPNKISTSRSFFELGGNSIKILSLKKKIEEYLKISISIPNLFRFSDIRSLAWYLSGQKSGEDQIKADIARDVSQMNTFFIDQDTDIAVIGMAGKFPGANSIKEFWSNIRGGTESVSFFSKEELLRVGIPERLLDTEGYIKAGSYLEEKHFFDSAFFGYTPEEASLMDPQIRLFHQICWHALEDAGYGGKNMSARTGLFAGGGTGIPWLNYIQRQKAGDINSFAALQYADISFLCSRVSYCLNLQGPSVYLNTACSTSLVAVHKASMSLLLRECDMAIAGGVRINTFSKQGYLYQEGMIYSRDGHCRPFDSEASGTIGGEGAGVVVLKRLQDAIRDRDQIYAILKGSGINNDGSAKMSYSAPSVEGQIRAIVRALQMSKIDPRSMSYLEAHGTGTPLGDPVEVEALIQAYGKHSDSVCALGSVKSNIGHLDTAAGIAGLIKAILILQHKEIPPSVNFSRLNPKIHLKETPFYIPTTLSSWESTGTPMRAGVSSLGIGGTNVHMILEEGPKKQTASSRPVQILTVSGKTASSLRRNVLNIQQYLQLEGGADLADISYTLNVGRKSHSLRHQVVCSTRAEAISELSDLLGGGISGTVHSSFRSPLVFMFPGQGSQYIGMCRDLYVSEPVFRDSIDQCFSYISSRFGKDIKSIVFSENGGSKLQETANTQPALFVIEYSLSRLLASIGLHADFMIGHSIGEYVGACLGGIFSLEDALSLVVMRGELMQKMPRGQMLSLSMSLEDLSPHLSQYPTLSLAAENSSNRCVVSGPSESIGMFRAYLSEQGIEAKVLATSHAFHSSMMDGMLEEYGALLEEIELGELTQPLLSNVRGELCQGSEMSKGSYWVDQLRQPVRFSKGLGQILEEENVVFLEVGPSGGLSSFVQNHEGYKESHQVVRLLGGQRYRKDTHKGFLRGIGKLWSLGIEPDWEKYYSQEKRNKVSVPGYAFEKTQYPVDIGPQLMPIEGSSNKGEVKRSFEEWFYAPTWQLSPKPVSSQNLEDKGTTLVFCDNYGVGSSLIKQLKNRGEQVICLYPQNHKIDADLSNAYSIDLEDEYAILHLLQELKLEGVYPNRLVHCWGITDIELGMTKPEDMELYFYSLLHTIKACQSAEIVLEHVAVLTSGIHDIIEVNLGCSPTKALGIAFLKVLAQEFPSLKTTHIDISLNEEFDDAKVLREVYDTDSGKVVSFRNSKRWVQTFEPLNIDQELIGSTIRRQGVYLITGGLGSVGTVISNYLSRKYQAHLILVGREQLPSRADWDSYSNDSVEASSILERIEKIRGIENRGGKVLYLACDISNEVEFANLLAHAESQFGQINGVIHAAGITSDLSIKSIAELGKNDFDLQYRSKLWGLESLYKILKNYELDFCILTSSISSILGGIGFGAYATANVFMDSFVLGHNKLGKLKNWISLNLDAISFHPGQTEGLAIESNDLPKVIEYVLALKEFPQVLVSVSEFDNRLANWIRKENKALSSEKEESFGEEKFPIHTLSDVEQSLQQIWGRFFGREDLSIRDDFFEIGGDSLKALTLISRINKGLGINLSIRELFEKPTIKTLAAFISEGIEEKFDSPQKLFFISPADPKSFYDLSPAQRRLYFLSEMDPTSLAYNLPLVIRLVGELDRAKVEMTFQKLVARHEILRTSFVVIEEQPYQKVYDEVEFSLAYLEVSEAEAPEIIKGFIQPFELDKPGLIRVSLAKLASLSHLLMIDMHHIVTDGVSQGILIRDFMALYQGEELPKIELHYKDYSEWQKGEYNQVNMAQHKAFWLEEFSSGVTMLDIPTDYARPILKSFEGRNFSFELSNDEVQGIRYLEEELGATNFMILLAALNILLSKLSNQEDITIGTAVAGRDLAEWGGIMGMFVNTLALRNFPRGELTFREFVEEIKEKSLSCFEHQAYPYEELIGTLQVPRDTSRNPLFDVMLVSQNFSREELLIPGLTIVPYLDKHNISKFDLEITIEEGIGSTVIDFEYATDLFEQQTIEKYAAYFRKIISEVTADVDKKIFEIDILSSSEREEILADFNSTSVPYALDQTFVDLFEKQVVSHGSSIAVRDHSKELSYQDLNRTSNQLAYFLLSRGVSNDQPVVVLCDRSVDLLVSFLGILKSGGCYVPLSLDYPISRIVEIFADTQSPFLLTHSYELDPPLIEALSARLPRLEIICLDEEELSPDRLKGELGSTGTFQLFTRAEWSEQPESNPSVGVHPSDLAYILYTSGSTGKPKGVMIEHVGMLNHLYAKRDALNLHSGSVVAQNASATFDISIWQMLSALLVGGETVIYGQELVLDPSLFLSHLVSDRVSILEVVPSYLSVLLGQVESESSKIGFPDLSYLLVTGETLPKSLVSRWFGHYPLIPVVNAYGPTEASDDITHFIMDGVPEGSSIPIGRVLPNLQIYIVDKNMHLCPVGVKGELLVSGIGVGRGYLNQASHTASVFKVDPFSPEPGRRMYCTGDLGRWLPDGNIEFLGRKDSQIKLRGHRIELGEIESHLSSHPSLTGVAVLLKERAGEKYLVSYYVCREELSSSAVQEYLSKRLPEYMLPGYYVELDTMPLTPNGKIDRKSLPDPEFKSRDVYVAPRNELEEVLSKVWSEVLGVDPVGIQDNFFSLGGDSIKSIQVRSRLRAQGYNLSVRDIFNHQSIETLSAVVHELTHQADQSVVQGNVPLTGIQHRFLGSTLAGKHHYNQSVMLHFPEGISPSAVRRIFTQLQHHHDALRMVYSLGSQ